MKLVLNRKFREWRFRTVVTAHVFSFREKIAGEVAHSDAADADEVDVWVGWGHFFEICSAKVRFFVVFLRRWFILCIFVPQTNSDTQCSKINSI